MLDRFSFADEPEHNKSVVSGVPGIWQERQEAEAALVSYLSDLPSTSRVAVKTIVSYTHPSQIL